MKLSVIEYELVHLISSMDLTLPSKVRNQMTSHPTRTKGKFLQRDEIRKDNY